MKILLNEDIEKSIYELVGNLGKLLELLNRDEIVSLILLYYECVRRLSIFSELSDVSSLNQLNNVLEKIYSELAIYLRKPSHMNDMISNQLHIVSELKEVAQRKVFFHL